MRNAIIAFVVAIGVALGSSAHADAAEPGKLVVGTIPVAPFIIKNPDGSWSGISIDLWRSVARELNLDYEIRELAMADIKDPAKVAQLDAFVSMNVNATNETRFDLTHAFYSTGLAIAVAPKQDGGALAIVRAIFTRQFAKVVAGLFAVLLGIGLLMWLVERRRNEPQFGGPPARGIGAGLWWSAVTMTTVGYGDKSPITFPGRVLALVWMFAAIIMISSFTASISSALTVNQLSSVVSGPGDLPRVRVATVEGSEGSRYLQRRQIAYRGYPDAEAAVTALANGAIDAVVYEAPVLQYQVKRRTDASLRVLDGTFYNHGYAFGLRTGSPLREQLNLALLSYVATDEWSATLAKYLGAP